MANDPPADFDITITQDQWHAIADGLDTPWPRTAAHVDAQLWAALGAPLRPHQAAVRWGWDLPRVREFFRPGNTMRLNDGDNRE